MSDAIANFQAAEWKYNWKCSQYKENSLVLVVNMQNAMTPFISRCGVYTRMETIKTDTVFGEGGR